MKREIRKHTRASNSPKRLWTFLGQLVVRWRSLTALKIPSLDGRTPFEHVKGYTPDISPWVTFGWYDWVYYLDEDRETHLGRWLGPAEGYGAGDCHWILPVSARPLVC